MCCQDAGRFAVFWFVIATFFAVNINSKHQGMYMKEEFAHLQLWYRENT